MPAYENLNSFQSGRYVRLHRGFAGLHHDEVNENNLGHHWVGDNNPQTADKFATEYFGNSDFTGGHDREENKGTVLVGLVHKRHMLKPGTPEHEYYANEGMGSVESEQEIPLRRGTPVHIVQATDFNRDGNDTYHEFTPRRRGKA
jgi:hypothetical protein